MKKTLHIFLAAALAVGSAGLAFADSASNPNTETRLPGEVRHQLAMIPQVTVFDNLAYRVDGGTVTLYGQVRNAFIKDEAQNSVKHLEGVERINNQIEVLPASFSDDRIRRQMVRAIYNSSMVNYALQPEAPIRIIVKNGHVDLEGVVRTKMDKTLAFIHANEVPGVFSVQNNLQVELPKKG